MKDKIEQLLNNMIETPQSYCSSYVSFEESYQLLSYLLYDKSIVEDVISFTKFKDQKIPGPVASIAYLTSKIGGSWDLFMGLFTEFHNELKHKYKNK